ncbi:hypothetical protein L9F63_000187, partial [Diploptera punctata]
NVIQINIRISGQEVNFHTTCIILLQTSLITTIHSLRSVALFLQFVMPIFRTSLVSVSLSFSYCQVVSLDQSSHYFWASQRYIFYGLYLQALGSSASLNKHNVEID